MQAAGNINLISNNVTNAGLINSLAGNINIQAAASGLLAINNTNGVMQALAGSISVTNSAADLSSGISMVGGDYLSQQLNVDAGNGYIQANVGQVTGIVNLSACSADFGAASPTLTFGTLNVTGDPTYFNTNGSVVLSSVLPTNGNDLSIVASQDVVVQGGTIDTTIANDGSDSNPSVDNGGNITIIAGASFTANPTQSGQVNGDSSTTLTISQSNLSTHGSATGGAIDLSGVTAINSNGTLTLHGLGGNGGNITLVAFSGNGNGSTHTPGSINLGTTGIINSYGTGPGADSTNNFWGGNKNGNVTVIAGATTDPSGSSAIVLPPIFAGSSMTNSDAGVVNGNVSVFNATPNLSRTVTVLNGVASHLSAITAGTNQANASITFGSLGGLSTLQSGGNLIQAWQQAAAAFALPIINDTRTNPSDPTDSPVGTLAEDPLLDAMATDEANYLAATAHFAHFDLQGGTPSGRGAAINLTAGSLCCAENIAYQAGAGSQDTPAQVFVQGHFDMYNQEPSAVTCGGCFNHHVNYMDPNHKYIGIGFANFGGAIYFVEDFADALPQQAPTTIANVPLNAGVGGRAGLIAVQNPLGSYPGIHLTIGAVGGSFMTPTSIYAGAGATVTINGGNTVNVPGFILANGINGFQGFTGGGLTGGPLDGTKGGTINITSGGSLTLSTLQANGGAGGSSYGGSGGAGGSVSVTSTNGDITITPGSPSASFSCAPCVAIAVAGGAGGQALSMGSPGGNGGAGGTVSLSAPHGNILLTAIEAGGGGGGGGAGGGGFGQPGGTQGGAGGAGGTVKINADNTTGANVVVQYYINASGGGGGGAGGQNSGANAGGGGGGGAFGMSGFGGTGSGKGINPNSDPGGGGGGGAEIHEFGGPSQENTDDDTSSSTGLDGAAGTGGTAGAFGGGGGGGKASSASGDNGGNGGNMGAAGSSDQRGLVSGGAGGAGGSITIQGQTVTVQSNVNGFWGNTFNSQSVAPPPNHGPVQGADSLLALGSSGTVTIASQGGIQQIYSADSTYAGEARGIPLALGAFTVGSGGTSGNGTFGTIEAGSPSGAVGAITINGNTPANSPLTSGTFSSSGGTSSVTIKEGPSNTPVTFHAGDLVTPAEIVAIRQVALGGSGAQTLNLDLNGNATAGSLTISLANVPNGGFTTLTLPAGVTLNDGLANLSYSTNATISSTATLVVSNGGSTATISTPTLTINGSISNPNSAASSSLNIQGTGSGNSLSLTFGANGSISTTNGGITFNGTSSGAVSTTTSGLGSLSAGGSGSLVSFNGGSGAGASAINVSFNSIAGTLTAGGSSVQLSTASGSLTVGTLGAVSSLQLTSGGALTISGPATGNSITLQTAIGSGASIAVGSTVTASGANNLVSISVNSAGQITQSAGGNLSGLTVQLSSGSGNIGGSGSGAAIAISNTGTLKLNSTSGSAFASNTGTISLGQSTLGSSSQLVLTSSGTITTSGAVGGNQITLQGAANSGAGIVLASALTGSGSNSQILLKADGAGTISEGTGGSASAITVNLQSGSGNIGGSANGAPIITVTGTSLNLLLSSTGSAFISNTGAVNLGSSILGSSSGAQLVLTATGTITTQATVSANSITLKGASGSGAGVIIGSPLTGTGTNSTITLQADGAGTISETGGGSPSSSTLSLVTASGNIGASAGSPFNFTATNLSVTTNGTSANAFLASPGSVNLTQASVGGQLVLSSQASVTTASGSITTGATGTDSLALVAGSTGSSGANLTIGTGALTSGGKLRLENDDLADGKIVLQDNAILSSQGEVDIVVGAVPGSPTIHNGPNNITVIPNNSNVFFGPAGITAVGNSVINVTLFTTVFNISGGQTSSAIKVGTSSGGVNINSGAAIASLDLTVQNNVNALIALQQKPVNDPLHIGGTLSFVNGQAVGNVIFNSSDTFSNVIGENIPSGVTLTFVNFKSTNPINVSTTASAPSVVIKGTEQFVSSPVTPAASNAFINITSAQAAPALSISGAGALTSDFNLTVNVQGGISTSGTGGISAGNNLSLVTTNNGTMSFGTSISGGGTTTLTAAGNVTQTAGLISGTILNLTSSSGNLGGGNVAGALNTAASTISASANNGSVFINNTASALNLLASSALSTFNLTTSGNLSVSGNVSSGVGGITLTALNGSSIQFPNSVSLTGNTTLNANSGVVQASGTVSVTGNLIINAAALFNPGLFQQQSGQPTLNIGSNNSVGTIASTGDLVLANNTIVNSAGLNLVLLAQGNIESNGLAQINLTGNNGHGGTLAVIAGESFTVSPSGAFQIPDTNHLFTLGGGSIGGGSINLSNVAISTGGTGQVAANTFGGPVLLVANAGQTSKGVILVGSINTSSQQGAGGSVTFIAPGGVIVAGAINTSGPTGGGTLTINGAPPSISGTIQVSNGFLSPGGSFSPGSLISGSGAAVYLNGPINTSSAIGSAGAVLISAESAIQVGGSINSTGGTTSGAVALSTLNGVIQVSGDITSSGVNNNSQNGQNGGTGGAVALTAPEYITVSGSINTSGGNSNGSGNGGGAGNVTLSTIKNADNSQNLFTGLIVVQGAIIAAGGNASIGSGGGAGGAGGVVSTTSGAIQVLGQTSAPGQNGPVSILASGGSGSSGAGGAGSVAINTYAVQQLPSNFNLTSSLASEFALPGGMFNAGVNSTQLVVNGTFGSIVAGSTVVNNANGAALGQGSNSFGSGAVVITINSGAGSQIAEGATNPVITSATGQTRNQVTPGEALALYQVSLGVAQTVGLTASGGASIRGLVTDQGPGGNGTSTLTVTESDLPQSFSNFVLATNGANTVTLNVTGITPILNLPTNGTTVLNGHVNFTTANNFAVVNSGQQQLTIGASGALTATNQLGLLVGGGQISNNGQISAQQIVPLSQNGSLTITNNAAGTIGAPNGSVNPGIVFLSGASPNQLSLINNGGTMTVPGGGSTLPVLFASQQLPTCYVQVVGGVTPGAQAPSSIQLSFTLAGPGGTQQTAVIGGQLSNVNQLSIQTQSSQVSHASTPLTIGAGSSPTNFNIGQSIQVNTNGNLTVSTSTIQAGQQINIQVNGGTFTDNGGNSYTAANNNGQVQIQAQNGIAIGAASSVTGGQGIQLQTNSGPIALNGAATSSSTHVNLTSAQQIQINAGGTTGDVTLSNGTLGFGANQPNNIQIQSSGTTGITLTSESLLATQQVGLQVNNGALLDNGGSTISATNAGGTSGQVQLQSHGAMTIGSASSASTISTITGPQGIQLNAQGPIALSGFSGAALTTLTSGQQININGQGTFAMTNVKMTAVGTNVNNGSIQLQAQGGITVTTGQMTAGQQINLQANNGAFLDNGGNPYLSNSGQIQVQGGTGITFGAGSSVTGPQGIQMQTNNGAISLNGTSSSASTHVNLTSSQQIQINAGGTTGNVTLSNGTLGFGAGLPNNIQVQSSGATGITLTAESLLATQQVGLQANNGALQDNGGSTISANSGGGTNGQVQLQSRGAMTIGNSASAALISTITGPQGIQLSSQGAITLAGFSGATLTTLTSGQQINISAQGSFGMTDVKFTAVGANNNGSIQVQGQGGITVTAGQMTSNQQINLQANNGAFLDTGNNLYTSNGGQLQVQSGTTMTFGAGTSLTGPQGIQLQTSNGAIALNGTTGSHINLTSAQQIQIIAGGTTGNVTLSNGTLGFGAGLPNNIQVQSSGATGITLTAESLLATQQVGLQANNGALLDNGGSTISATNVGGTSGQVQLQSRGAMTIGNSASAAVISTITGPQGIQLSSQGAITLAGFSGATLTTLTSAQQININAQGSFSMTDVKFTCVGANNNGSIQVQGQGGITVATGQMTANQQINLQANNGAFLDNGGNSYTSNFGQMQIQASSGITFGAGTSLTGPQGIQLQTNNGPIALNGSAGSHVNLTSAQQIQLNAGGTTGNVTLSNGTLGFGAGLPNSIQVQSSGSAGIQLTSESIMATQQVSLQANNGALLDNGGSTINSTSGQINLQGSSITLGAGTVINAAGQVPNPNQVTLNAQSQNGFITLGAVAGSALTINASQLSMQTNGNITTGKALLTANQQFTAQSNSGVFLDNGSSLFKSSSSTVSIQALSVTLGAASSVQAANGVGLTANGQAVGFGIIALTGSVSTTTGAINVQASSTVSINANITAGSLGNSPHTPLLPNDIANSGSINVTSGSGSTPGGITIASSAPVVITANGGNVTMTSSGVAATSVGMTLGSSSTNFLTETANGGNVIMLTSGQITGSTGNKFNAVGVGLSTSSSVGGGIELGSGTTSSQLQNALNASSGSVPAVSIGSAVTINNPTSGANTHGVVQANLTNNAANNSINLTTSGTHATTLNLNGGAVLFDSNGPSGSVKLDGATFTVNALRPIAYRYSIAPEDDGVTVDDGSSTEQLAIIFTSGSDRAQTLTATSCDAHTSGSAGGSPAPDTKSCAHGQKAFITFHAGEMFLQVKADTTIRTAFGEVLARKDSLLSLALEGAGLRVIALSGPGHVTVQAGNSRISLPPGKEIVVSDHQLSIDEKQKGDGIGRRDFRTYVAGETLHVTVSDVSLTSMLANSTQLRAMRHPAGLIEKKVAARLIKTAAVVDQVTRQKGAYVSRNASVSENADLTPVRYVQ
jgi:hypothetical protein